MSHRCGEASYFLTSLINLAALTCNEEACHAARNGSEVFNGSNTLVGALIRLVVLGVNHVGEGKRAVGQYATSLVRNKAHEGAVFLPLYACRRGCVAVC